MARLTEGAGLNTDSIVDRQTCRTYVITMAVENRIAQVHVDLAAMPNRIDRIGRRLGLSVGRVPPTLVQQESSCRD
jgi:hypothetical protein